ncbi:FAD-binding domain-containing protein [Synechococcus elongatus IITB7]|uniref:FAD-binding domain-containing protein n=1 Tax=Synechococcus elongatus TaxID=32046 RepID=UPI0030D5ABCB
MAAPILFWHRRDLRLSDNIGLAAARSQSAQLIGLFCLDPQILQSADIAPARVAYLLGCLQELQQRYQQAGSRLLLLQGDPQRLIPQVAQQLQAEAVYWNCDVEPYGRDRDAQVAAALQTAGIRVVQLWDQLLHNPEQILSGSGTAYSVYGPFWKNWQAQPKPTPVATPTGLVDLSPEQLAAVAPLLLPELPTLKQLGFDWDGGFPVEPGEAAAIARLQEFCDRAIADYDPQRNFPAEAGTSGLSPAFKFGAIGIRQVWQAASQAHDLSRSEEARNSIRVWQQELAWREFYQHALYHFPRLADGPYRPLWQQFPWENREDLFTAWTQAQTGYPIVDAAMRQLTETGWMHNRCRMIVASFLTKDLIIDWRRGEQFFMQHLVDGDLAANNGGWQWSASSGMDPKPLRIFNPASQAKKFDATADYIKRWLPELRHVHPKDLISGEITPIERRGYPAPIVSHNLRQKQFKELYNQLKAAIAETDAETDS